MAGRDDRVARLPHTLVLSGPDRLGAAWLVRALRRAFEDGQLNQVRNVVGVGAGGALLATLLVAHIGNDCEVHVHDSNASKALHAACLSACRLLSVNLDSLVALRTTLAKLLVGARAAARAGGGCGTRAMLRRAILPHFSGTDVSFSGTLRLVCVPGTGRVEGGELGDVFCDDPEIMRAINVRLRDRASVLSRREAWVDMLAAALMTRTAPPDPFAVPVLETMADISIAGVDRVYRGTLLICDAASKRGAWRSHVGNAAAMAAERSRVSFVTSGPQREWPTCDKEANYCSLEDHDIRSAYERASALADRNASWSASSFMSDNTEWDVRGHAEDGDDSFGASLGGGAAGIQLAEFKAVGKDGCAYHGGGGSGARGASDEPSSSLSYVRSTVYQFGGVLHGFLRNKRKGRLAVRPTNGEFLMGAPAISPVLVRCLSGMDNA